MAFLTTKNPIRDLSSSRYGQLADFRIPAIVTFTDGAWNPAADGGISREPAKVPSRYSLLGIWLISIQLVFRPEVMAESFPGNGNRCLPAEVSSQGDLERLKG